MGSWFKFWKHTWAMHQNCVGWWLGLPEYSSSIQADNLGTRPVNTHEAMAPEEFEQRDTLAKLGPLGQVQLGYSISRCDPNVPLIFHQLCISTINLSYTTILSYWPGRVNWGIWEFWPLHRLMWSSVQDCRSPNKINGHFRNRFIGGTCHIIYKGYVRAILWLQYLHFLPRMGIQT